MLFYKLIFWSKLSPQILMITVKYVLIIGSFQKSEIEVFVDISVSPFNVANMSRKYIYNLAADRWLWRIAQTQYKVCCR